MKDINELSSEEMGSLYDRPVQSVVVMFLNCADYNDIMKRVPEAHVPSFLSGAPTLNGLPVFQSSKVKRGEGISCQSWLAAYIYAQRHSLFGEDVMGYLLVKASEHSKENREYVNTMYGVAKEMKRNKAQMEWF